MSRYTLRIPLPFPVTTTTNSGEGSGMNGSAKKRENQNLEDLSHESLIQMSYELNAKTLSLNMKLDEKFRSQAAYVEEAVNLQRKTREKLQSVLEEYDQLSDELENKRKTDGVVTKADKQKLDEEKEKKFEMEIQELREKLKVTERLRDEAVKKMTQVKWELQDNEKKFEMEIQELREKLKVTERLRDEAAEKMRHELEDKEKKFEMEIGALREELKVMKRLRGESAKKMELMKLELEDKIQDLNHSEQMNTNLMVKERGSNDEIQEARKELIEAMQDLFGHQTKIGIKRMGELNQKVFLNACKLKYPPNEAQMEASILCSFWESNLKDSHWHPFKILIGNGKSEEVVNENDEKLKGLRREWGDDVYNAVVLALKEMNEYNGSGRFAVPELWNFKEDRKATLKEGINSIAKKRKRTRC